MTKTVFSGLRYWLSLAVLLGTGSLVAGTGCNANAEEPAAATAGASQKIEASETAEETESDEAPKLTKAEQEFVDLLSNSVMVGSFTVDGQEKPPREERYSIGKVTKGEGGNWTVESRISYGKVDVAVPVVVQVQWGGDVPVLGVTDLTIPLVGSEFTARILFHQQRYAGTWMHGKVGGHMFGRIERAKPADNVETPK
ncbi:MAG: hypothetical protein R3C01_12495 [Planctomycetaceae bacterium]